MERMERKNMVTEHSLINATTNNQYGGIETPLINAIYYFAWLPKPRFFLTSLQKLTMFSQSSLASPSSFLRRASTCMLSLLFSGLTTFLRVRYCWGVWHAAQFLAFVSLSSVQAGQLHCPTFSWRFREEEEEELEAAAEEEAG